MTSARFRPFPDNAPPAPYGACFYLLLHVTAVINHLAIVFRFATNAYILCIARIAVAVQRSNFIINRNKLHRSAVSVYGGRTPD